MPFCDECPFDAAEDCDICGGSYSWESSDWQDDEDDPRMCCMGDACLNPHPHHTAAECFDLEMAQAWEEEANP